MKASYFGGRTIESTSIGHAQTENLMSLPLWSLIVCLSSLDHKQTIK